MPQIRFRSFSINITVNLKPKLDTNEIFDFKSFFVFNLFIQNIAKNWISKLFPNIKLKTSIKKTEILNFNQRTLIKKLPGANDFYSQGGRTFKWTLIFRLFSNGDQVKVKLINLKFPKTNNLG